MNSKTVTMPECAEGPEAFQKFDTLVGKLLLVPHEEIMRREVEYKKKSELNPHRRGPKRNKLPEKEGSAPVNS
jgi:hypothetical protein